MHSCLTVTDHDEENQQSSDYQSPTRRVPTDPDYPYVLRNHILYSAKEYNELEFLYHKAMKNLKKKVYFIAYLI